MEHAAAALIMLSEMEYTGANSHFIRVILLKKYSLPRRAVSALIEHFKTFIMDDRVLPVLWHSCLLSFVQLYGERLMPQEKAALAEVVRAHPHHQITPEISKFLSA